MLFIPEGFAHGFCVLSDEAEVIYYCSKEYAPELERTILWNDPVIAVAWPVKEPLLSPKDLAGKSLSAAENNFSLA
jgi:dTDP-4-dehydrorhamnose 3,5-epimerase